MYKQILLLCLFFSLINVSWAQSPSRQIVDLPPELEAWQSWVLHDHPNADCPFLYNTPTHTCIWPSKLKLDLNEHGGKFELQVDSFAEQWIPLPGGAGYWPKNVTAQSKSVAVVQRQNKPFVLLKAGQHNLSGEWQWQNLPRTLPVTPNFGLLSVTVNQRKLMNPSFASEGKLWLAAKNSQVKKTDRDSLDVKVFRHIEDGNPMKITTLVRLVVSGKEREMQTGPLLLPGFTPLRLSSKLPVRVEKDGSLRAQIKPGRWDIRLVAYSDKAQTELSYLGGKNTGNNGWPQQEVWVFSAESTLRTVQIGGVVSMDPNQTQLPDAWKALPAYLVPEGTAFKLNVMHRGDPNPPSNRLSLKRTLWLDFDGAHYTVRDKIVGSLNQSDRLEMNAPYQLGRVDLAGAPQVVTQLKDDGNAGVEVRNRALDLTAISLFEKTSLMPVTGWQTEFDSVHTTLHLPPGWSLLHATGADSVYGSWLGDWSLWKIFLILVISVSIARVSKPLLGLLAFATLLITFQYSDAPLWVWLNLAAVLALLPFAKGRFKIWISGYWWLSFAALIMILLPLSVQQVRQAIYLQLEKPWQTVSRGGSGYDEGQAYNVPVTDMAESLMEPEAEYLAKEVSQFKSKRRESKRSLLASSLSSQKQVYDPNQKIQVGPGLPSWQWNSVSLRWSGPVLPEEKTRIFLITPQLNRLSLLLSIILPALLGFFLLRQFQLRAPDLSVLKLKQALTSTLLLMVFIGVTPEDATADVVIDNEILKVLEERLIAPPKCMPTCISVESVNIIADKTQVEITMALNSNADIALPLPALWESWWPTSVRVNNQPASVLQSRKGQLYIRLTQGHHLVSIGGGTGKGDSIDLPFSLPLNNVTSTLQGWSISGVPSAKQSSQSLQLIRDQDIQVQKDRDRLLPDPIAPYVIVTRRLELGLEWSVTTQVDRVAPIKGPIHLSIPLLPGEAPNGGEVDANGNMSVHFGAKRQSVTWRSSLKQSNTIHLTAATGKPWAEVWLLQTSEVWHSEVSGIPTIALSANTQSAKSLAPIWQPWPGEQVTIQVTRPKAIVGRQLGINAVNLEQKIGKRADDVSVTFQMRATQGGQYDFDLPDNATFKGVQIDGIDSPISHSNKSLKIPIKPGEHSVQIEWQVDSSQRTGLQRFKQQTPAIDLKGMSTNINLNLQLPRDSWLLAVGGPAMGPAILFWGVLAVVLVIAVVLGRTGLTPLKAYEWVLLSLGICTFNLYVLALIAVWLITLNFRGKKAERPSNRKFNLAQVALFGFSLFALMALLSSIPISLLSRPDMMVAGNGSSISQLWWYQDQSTGQLPQAWAITLPIMVYRIAMLIWSLWLAFALMRWIPWAWRQLGVQGYWYVAPKAALPEGDTE